MPFSTSDWRLNEASEPSDWRLWESCGFILPDTERIFFLPPVYLITTPSVYWPLPGHPGHCGTVIRAAMFFLKGDTLCVYFLFSGLYLISKGSPNIPWIFQYRLSALLKSLLLQPTALERAEGPGDVWPGAVSAWSSSLSSPDHFPLAKMLASAGAVWPRWNRGKWSHSLLRTWLQGWCHFNVALPDGCTAPIYNRHLCHIHSVSPGPESIHLILFINILENKHSNFHLAVFSKSNGYWALPVLLWLQKIVFYAMPL